MLKAVSHLCVYMHACIDITISYLYYNFHERLTQCMPYPLTCMYIIKYYDNNNYMLSLHLHTGSDEAGKYDNSNQRTITFDY